MTFLGPHGHCEAGAKEFPLYNSDDTPDGYEKHGSSTSKSRNERSNPTSQCYLILIICELDQPCS